MINHLNWCGISPSTIHGGFLKGYTPYFIIHFSGIFPSKNHPAIGDPPFLKFPQSLDPVTVIPGATRSVHDEVNELVQLYGAVLVHVGLAEEFPWQRRPRGAGKMKQTVGAYDVTHTDMYVYIYICVFTYLYCIYIYMHTYRYKCKFYNVYIYMY